MRKLVVYTALGIAALLVAVTIIGYLLPQDHVVSVIADSDLPFGGSWTYELRPEGSGTQVIITERGEVYNPIFRFMSRFVFGHTATMEKVLASLVQ